MGQGCQLSHSHKHDLPQKSLPLMHAREQSWCDLPIGQRKARRKALPVLKIQFWDEHTGIIAKDTSKQGLEYFFHLLSRVKIPSKNKEKQNPMRAIPWWKNSGSEGLQYVDFTSCGIMCQRIELSGNAHHQLGATAASKLLATTACITCFLRCWTALSVSTPAQASAKRRHPLNCTSNSLTPASQKLSETHKVPSRQNSSWEHVVCYSSLLHGLKAWNK